jgi:hemin uptake protein HemP
MGNLVKRKYFTMGYGGGLETTNEYSYLETSDGETWTTPDKAVISGFISGNQTVTYTGKIPVVLTSKDGIVWTRLAPSHSDQPTPTPTPAATVGNQNVPISENGIVIELNGQTYKLNLNSSIGQSMEVQASTDLEIWETLTTITNAGGVLNFVDPDAKYHPQRFYRLKLQ